MEEKFAVIALGGNAILQRGQLATPENQLANLRDAVEKLTPALSRYKSFALTHGNGPQVGNDLIRSHQAHIHADIAELGLADCVANTQGRIGHWIIHEMKNHRAFRDRPVACIMTHVYVEKNEFASDEYTKRVGPWIDATAEKRGEFDRRGIRYLLSEDGQKLIRVVPSPRPYKIEEFEHIAHLLDHGIISICCGGGGIPVFDTRSTATKGRGTGATETSGGTTAFPGSGSDFQRADVVIDKDLASSLLACGLLKFFDGANVELVILMETKGLYKDKSLANESFISAMTLDELDSFMETTSLEKGTILPKLEAIRQFLEAGGRKAYLGPLDGFGDIFDDARNVGTVFSNIDQMQLYEQK